MADRLEDVGNGALFKIDRKEKPSHPDYRGDCEINTEKFGIAAWINTSKGGTKYMSLGFRPPKEEPAAPTADDEIAF